MKAPAIPASSAALHVLLRTVRPLHRHLTRTIEERLGGTGLSVSVRGLLERLYEAGPQSIPQLGWSLMIRRQVAHRLVQEAEALGFVERVVLPAQGRVAAVALSEDGRHVIQDVLALEEQLLARLAAAFEADDVEAATRVLQKLTATMAEEAVARDDRDP